MNPHIVCQSPLQKKLKGISYFSYDFENDDSKRKFAKLVDEVGPMLKILSETFCKFHKVVCGNQFVEEK